MSNARNIANLPNGDDAPVYACRAWVNFDGTTNTAGFCTIRDSGNVSTVADNGTGDYTVNFTTAMPDANYATTFGCDFYEASNYPTVVNTVFNGLYSTTSVRIQVTYAYTTALQNSPRINVAVFR